MVKLPSILTVTVLMISVLATQEIFAQTSHMGAKVNLAPPLTGNEPSIPFLGISYPVPYALGPGDSIGFTRYDFGTNGSPNRNLINYDNTIISLARMAAQEVASPDRGSWVACSTDGGATWPPLTKIESIRTGWTNIDQIVDDNGTASVVSHDAITFSLHHYVDTDRCANVWSGGTTGITAIWPRIGVGSGFGMHVLHGDANPPTDVLYSHSPDAGSTWDVMRTHMFNSPGFVASADGWNITAQGDNVALVSAGRAGDVIVVSSTDGGSTWSEQVIYDIDNSLLTPQDVPDASCSAVYDLAGNLHVVWGNFYANGDGINLYYSIDAGIYHWSEATGVQEIALPTQDSSVAVPVGTMGVTPGVATNGDLASCPDIGVDDNNNLYVIYQNYISEKDVNLFNYQHPYGLGSSDGGATWATPIDLTPGVGFDASFATMADHVGQYVHISYLSDPFVGNALRGCHPENNTAIMYLKVDKNTLLPAAVATIEMEIDSLDMWVPPEGDTIAVNVVIENITLDSQKVDFWAKLLLPDGTIRDLAGPKRTGLAPSEVFEKEEQIFIPGIRPAGDYSVIGYVGTYPNLVFDTDSAGFTKLSAGLSGVSGETDAVPKEMILGQNYPNPFNPSTVIRYGLPERTRVRLEVFNLLGQSVAVLVDGEKEAGFHESAFASPALASGPYIYRLTAGNFVQTKKLILLR